MTNETPVSHTKQPPQTEIINETASKITEKIESDDFEEWQKAYLAFLKTEKTDHSAFALVELDDDGIPELYLTGGCEATGDSVCAFRNGSLIEQHLQRTWGGSYIPGSGEFANENGNFGRCYTRVYRLEKGEFVQTFDALLVESAGVNIEGELYELRYEYFLGEKQVSEGEYLSARDASFEFEKAIPFHEGAVSYEKICELIVNYE
ncbi:MAG: hypothetical protein E7580_03450 [Ruminococcaceae bacterium]|nr:hypothetical protein [Oscillospiraceae bacterium]